MKKPVGRCSGHLSVRRTTSHSQIRELLDKGGMKLLIPLELERVFIRARNLHKDQLVRAVLHTIKAAIVKHQRDVPIAIHHNERTGSKRG